jgi:hypothetical protein
MLASRRLSRTVSAVIALALLALAVFGVSTAVAGPTVTVRVEGESATLLPQTAVTLNAPEPVSGCPADSVAAAINLAVDGNWDHGEVYGEGDFTETILGETHEFTHNSDTWAEWVDDKWGGGICNDLLSEGDEVLMIADHEPAPTFAPTSFPLVVSEVPSSAQVGVPFKVHVNEVIVGAEAPAGAGTPTPVAGATVTGAGVVATPSDASGSATVTLTSPGNVTLRATKAPDAPSLPFVVCADVANDGGCGSPGPTGSTSTAAGSSPAALYKGPFAVVAAATGVADNHVYAQGHAPKVLSGSVVAHTRLASVSLRLRREYRGHCSAYDGASERFVKARCGQGSFFKVSTMPSFSYLLPAELARGRYVLDLEATDVAGNTTTLARGTSRIVFYVR